MYSLQLYDDEKSNTLHANEVIEVAGFLSLRSGEGMDEDDCDFATLPVIHVIHVECGSSTFSNMLDLHKGKSHLSRIPSPGTFELKLNNFVSNFLEYIFQNASSLRDELWIMLTDILLGNTLAADYLICHLISSV